MANDGGRRLQTTNGLKHTGVSDPTYDLASVLYHAAKDGTVYAKYIEDAKQEGNQELADFFREVQHQDANRAPEGQGAYRPASLIEGAY